MSLNVGLDVISGKEEPERVQVLLTARDPISRDGVASQLRGHGVELVDERLVGDGVVGLIVVDQLDEESIREIRAFRRRGVGRLVLVAARVDDAGLLVAIEHGVSVVVRRSEATSMNLMRAIRAAVEGNGALPPDLLGRLMGQVGRLQRQVLNPRGLTFSGLTERELRVLCLLTEGLDTAEVGRRVFLSERTVKNVVHDVTSRLNARNRTHAVALALREGLI